MHDTHARTHHPTLRRRQAFWLMWSVNTPPPPFKGRQSPPHTHFMHLRCKKVECVECACGRRGGADIAVAAHTQICALLGSLVYVGGRNQRQRSKSSKASTPLNLFVSNGVKSSDSALPENPRQQSCSCDIRDGFNFKVGS